MLIIPAIDLVNGRCVRLRQGDFAQETVYAEDPLEVAHQWAALGGRRLHLVDLDAARGSGDNRAVIKRIAAELEIEIEVGGGLRSLADLEEILEAGADYAIIGSAAYTSPDLVEQAVTRFGEAILVGIDARDGQVAVQGWLETVAITPAELGRMMKESGVETVIFTDIAKDGMLSGPNLTASVELSETTGLNVIISGGVSTYQDLEQIAAEAANNPRISGAIIGKALYTGAIDLAHAISQFGGER